MSCLRRLIGVAGVLALSVAATGPAHANGRFPASVHVDHAPGSSTNIIMAATFGLLISNDDGASFKWICENAIGYSGIYDPDYALEADGTIWATTFEGLRVTRDGGCNWTTIGAPLTDHFIGDVEVAPDGTIWAATSTGGATNDLYKSTDGISFAPAGLSDGMAWWRRVRIAPTDSTRIYVSGFQPSQPAGDAMTPPEALAYGSTNGGQSWVEISLTGVVFGSVPQFDLLAVAPDDPNTVFAVAVGGNVPLGDSLYVSRNGGLSWEHLLDINDSILAFLVIGTGPNYELHVGTINDGNRISTNGGQSWTTQSEPRQSCISQRSDGTYFSCGANWEPDFFALGRSTDGVSWEKVVRFSEIAGPVSCDPGTVQFDDCESLVWPMIVQMFGIGATDAGPTSDAGPDAGTGGGGWFSCSAAGTGSALGALALLALVLWPLSRRRHAA
ncbi:MAG TPA: MYXO-CTERM sorting domain-containing protein [Kofleriaceae bacterium]|nr:MYXO-CTERM sorting domain-containing protein [Kofleriaceae bacterium]